MKCKIILMLAALCSMQAFAELKQALTLHTSGGGEIVYFLDQLPTVSFAGQDMVVATEDNLEGEIIPMENVESWTIGLNEFSAMPSLTDQSEACRISISGGIVTVHNPQGSGIEVFTIDGKKAASAQGQTAEFNLPRGIYIVKAANKTFKISNR